MKGHAVFQSKNFYLLTALLIYFICSPFVVVDHSSDFYVSVFMVFTILFCVNVVSRKKVTLYTTNLLAVMSLIGYTYIVFVPESKLFFIAHFIVNALFYGVMTLMVITAVAEHKLITLDTLLGSICGYLLIGLTWNYFYLVIASMDINAFSYQLLDGSIRDKIQHFIYFSFCTLTTLGYGDITPYSFSARTLAWLEAATGQIYLAVWISQLVGKHIAQLINRDQL